jgi:hypothetical protein
LNIRKLLRNNTPNNVIEGQTVSITFHERSLIIGDMPWDFNQWSFHPELSRGDTYLLFAQGDGELGELLANPTRIEETTEDQTPLEDVEFILKTMELEPEAQGRAVLEWLEEDRGERSSFIGPFLASVPFSCTGTIRSRLLERIADVDTLPLGNKTKERILSQTNRMLPFVPDLRQEDLEAYVTAVLRFLASSDAPGKERTVNISAGLARAGKLGADVKGVAFRELTESQRTRVSPHLSAASEYERTRNPQYSPFLSTLASELGTTH